MPDVIITLCTCPDQATAEKIARLLVESKFAACVNILPNVTSIYTWQGQVESAQEYQLVIKSAAANYPAIETAIRNHHPYELPEIIAVSVVRGLPAYLNWINSCHITK